MCISFSKDSAHCRASLHDAMVEIAYNKDLSILDEVSGTRSNMAVTLVCIGSDYRGGAVEAWLLLYGPLKRKKSPGIPL